MIRVRHKKHSFETEALKYDGDNYGKLSEMWANEDEDVLAVRLFDSTDPVLQQPRVIVDVRRENSRSAWEVKPGFWVVKQDDDLPLVFSPQRFEERYEKCPES